MRNKAFQEPPHGFVAMTWSLWLGNITELLTFFQDAIILCYLLVLFASCCSVLGEWQRYGWINRRWSVLPLARNLVFHKDWKRGMRPYAQAGLPSRRRATRVRPTHAAEDHSLECSSFHAPRSPHLALRPSLLALVRSAAAGPSALERRTAPRVLDAVTVPRCALRPPLASA